MASLSSSPSSATALVTSLPEIEAALGRIRAVGLKETPVLTSDTMDALSGHDLYFKCELFQKTGSFKARGASNACSLLPPGQAVVTHSSGNHAQAIAFAAAATQRTAHIVMPDTAPLPKQAATAGYGAEVTLCAPTNEARAAGAAAAAEASGGEIVHPSEDPRVIAGQGTVALELLAQVEAMVGGGETNREDAAPAGGRRPPLDVLVVPIGGGGLASGCAVACKALWPDMLVVGAEPSAMDDAFQSKQAGELRSNAQGTTTIADGLKTQLGPNTWPVVREKVDHILTVDEDDILSATALVWSRMKLQIEPSAGVGVAVALSEPFRDLVKGRQPAEKDQAGGAAGAAEAAGAAKKRKVVAEDGARRLRVGVVLCGGNADPIKLAPLLAAAPPYPKGALGC